MNRNKALVTHNVINWILFLLMLFPFTALAQERSDLRYVYVEAEDAYQIGKVDHAINLLKNNIGSFDGNVKKNALRLLSICYLSQDNTVESERYARMLLNINPYYTSTNDPIRFEEMMNRLKLGRNSTITTASSQSESVMEAPVPVTIITREMIEMLSNNKSIGHILATYVPGLTEVCSYAFSNISMHGVYTNGQEKILIMENGHRLNARSTNNGKLDYAISTEKIDHIEVLRGPASSLYGNVALTAVVNIITKKGSEINGVKAKYGLGSFNTHRADLLVGSTFVGADVMAWASIYNSDGEQISVPKNSGFSQTPHDGYTYVGRYDGKPSYDLGFCFKLNDFNFSLNHRYGKQVPQYSWYGETYDYDKFRQFCGVTPGYSIQETHLELGYDKDIKNSNFNVSVYGDFYKFKDYQPVSDSLITYEFTPDGSGTPVIGPDGKPKTRLYHGVYQDDNWEEYTIGAISKFSTSFTIGKTKANLLLGAQFEYYKIPINEFFFGEEYNRIIIVTTPESKNQLNVGSEKSISGFIQGKYYLLNDKLIFNGGLRYDNKFRKNNVNVSAYSPRIALIYLPSKLFSTKFSYSRSFVDAPYFYRQNTQNTYRGSEDLMPEYMVALQWAFLGSLSKHIDYDVNIFHHHLTDLICNNQSKDLNAPKYINSGSLKIAGVEGVVSYKLSSFSSRLGLTYQRVIDSEQYYSRGRDIYSIPSVTANFTCEKLLFNKFGHTFRIGGNMKYISNTLNKADSRSAYNVDFRLGSKALFDLRLKYNYKEFMQFSLDCDNVFNTDYYIGGTSYFPYKYPGRILMGTISYTM